MDESGSSSSNIRTPTTVMKRKRPQLCDEDLDDLRREQLKVDIEMKRLIAHKTRLQIRKLQVELQMYDTDTNQLDTNVDSNSIEAQMIYDDYDM
jgi:hypothetical protein